MVKVRRVEGMMCEGPVGEEFGQVQSVDRCGMWTSAECGQMRRGQVPGMDRCLFVQG